MIVPPGKHFRKWLFAVAVAARNRAQAVIAALASAEEAQIAQAGPETAAGGAKKAHAGGAPDHWVQLVARHAPELLQSGPAEFGGRPRPPMPGRQAGLNGLPLEDNRQQAFDSPTPEQGDPSRSFKLSRAPEEYDHPGNQRITPAPGHPGQSGGDNAMAGTGAASPGHIRDGAAPRDRATIRDGSVKPGRPAVAWSGAPKKIRRQSRGHRFSALPEPEDVFREAERPGKNAGVVRGSQSRRDSIVNQRTGLRKPQINRAAGPTARGEEPLFSKTPERSADSTGVAGMTISVEKKQALGAGIRPGPGRMSRELKSAQNTAQKISAPRAPVAGERAGSVNAARIAGGRRPADQRPQREKDTGNTPSPVGLCWPALPGEKESEGDGDAHRSDAWPDLPARRLAEAKPPSDQMDSDPAAAGSRDTERLRRLDEEQKGRLWNASHF